MAKAVGSTMWRTVKALPLTPYWQRRFARDMERCGRTASFSEVDDVPENIRT